MVGGTTGESAPNDELMDENMEGASWEWMHQQEAGSVEWNIQDYDSLSKISYDESLSNQTELVKESIRWMDEWKLIEAEADLKMEVDITEWKLVQLWSDRELFKTTSSPSLYKGDDLQKRKRALYEKSLYLSKINTLANKISNISTYELWNYESLKKEWMSGAKQAMVDWLKASLYLTGDKIVEKYDAINPFERARKSNALKKMKTIKEKLDDNNVKWAAITLFSSFTYTDRVPLFSQIKKLTKYIKYSTVFDQNIHPLTTNVIDQLKKQLERKRITWKMYLEWIQMTKTIYQKLTNWLTDSTVIAALAKA